MLLINFTEQQYSGIGGDVTAGEIGFNLAAGEWREGQFSGTIMGAAVSAWWIG